MSRPVLVHCLCEAYTLIRVSYVANSLAPDISSSDWRFFFFFLKKTNSVVHGVPRPNAACMHERVGNQLLHFLLLNIVHCTDG